LQAVTDFITGVGTGEKLRVHTHKNSELDPARKFARYLRAADLNDHANLVPFSEYARAKRGIATGDNSFFTLNESEISERGLKPSSFVLCLTKAQQTKTRLLTNKYMQDLKGSGQRVNLLYLDGSEDLNADSALATYIEEGEEREVNLRYLTRARTPWWAMERKDPPDIFATVFSREGIRFLRNEAGARSLACCHGIYVHESCDIELVMAWLLTDFAQEAVREERREYGAGLEKVEPGDINKSRIADFKAMTEGERELVLTQYRVWIQATRLHHSRRNLSRHRHQLTQGHRFRR
jgi:adenine-specific DNA-methyltransferase